MHQLKILLVIIIASAIALIGYFMIKVFNQNKSIATKENVEYLQPNSPGAQKLYDEKRDKDKPPAISRKNKLNLSWEFIYNITDKIMKTFTKADQSLLQQLGTILVNLGMKYEHVPDLSIKKEQLVVFAKEKKQQNTRSI